MSNDDLHRLHAEIDRLEAENDKYKTALENIEEFNYIVDERTTHFGCMEMFTHINQIAIKALAPEGGDNDDTN